MRNFKWIALAVGLGALGVYLIRRPQTTADLPLITYGNDLVTAGESMIKKVASLLQPRGIRNNNPGNVRTGTIWQGMAPEQTDRDFVVFASPEYGIRAMARILRTYINRGQNTVASIINTWAPPTENDTGSYVRQVASALNLDPNVPVPQDRMPDLIAAIIRHENGQQPYPYEVIARGVELERMG